MRQRTRTVKSTTVLKNLAGLHDQTTLDEFEKRMPQNAQQARQDCAMNVLLAGHEAELASLCRRFHVRRLELFGSAATGRLSPDSDLDFIVEFEQAARGTYTDNYFGLCGELEQHFGRPVDLIVSITIRNPYFRQSVDRAKLLVYAG